jgi:1,2-phenylacetyl-CoA epoxidase catalytic subunit
MVDTPSDDDVYRAGVVDLLGVLAYGELTAFERLAEDAAMAPTLRDKAALAAMASAEFGHFTSLRDHLLSMGLDPDAAMEPFRATFDDFHRHTRPADWLEGLVKAYVGDGLAADFYREIAAYVDSETRELILTTLDDTGTRSSSYRGCGPPSKGTTGSLGGWPYGGAVWSGRHSARRSRS